MSWNHRIVRRVFGDEESLGLHEVYYGPDGEPTSCTAEPVDVSSETLEGLRWVLSKMTEALTKPILEMSDIERHEVPGVPVPPASGAV